MRRSLLKLNGRHLPKALRQALVLFTLLILPSAAWGQITVGGNQPEEGNITGDNITGTVTFKVIDETSILTLNQATITGNIEYSGTYPLEIKLVGSVTMDCRSSSKVFKSTNAVSLSFSTTPTDAGSLTISDPTYTYSFDASDITTFSEGFTNISCSEGSGLVAASVDLGTISISNSYKINIGGVSVTTTNADNINGGNISGTGTVKYVHDAATNSGTLQLTGVTITNESNAPAISIPTSLRILTINIQGSNTIETTGDTYVIMSNRLSSSTVEFSGTGTLTLQKDGDLGLISNLTVDNNSYKDGLAPTYLAPGTASSLSNATKAVISPLGLTIAGIEVTSANASNITGSGISAEGGKVMFTHSTNYNSNDESTWPKLTLDNATINGDIVWSNSTIKELIIEINGKNSIINSEAAIKATNTQLSCTLSIKKADNAEEATLKLATSANKAISNFDQIFKVSELNMADAKVENSTYNYYTTHTVYGLKIAGTDVHDIEDEPGYKDKVLGDESVMFTPTTASPNTLATLTLSGATINGQILWSNDENLTIEISGLNKVNNASSTEDVAAITWIGETAPNLTIKKVEGAESASLILAGYNSTNISNENPITGFANTTSSLTYSYLRAKVTQTPDILYKCYSTEFYDLFMNLPVHNVSEDYLAHCGNIMNYSTPCVTFTKTNDGGVLTFDNATINTGFQTSLSNITVDLKGNNTITQYSGGTFFSGDNDVTPNVTFTTSSDPAGSLTMKVGAGATGPSVFANNVTITYDGGLTSSVDLLNESVTEAFIAKGTFTGLMIAGTPITSNNLDENGVISGVSGITGTVSFAAAKSDPETPATLTLNNASITGNIKFNSNLTVHLVGDNIITNPKDADTFYAFVFDNTYRELYLSTDETKPGTLTFVELGPETGSLTKKDYITTTDYNMINSGTVGDVTWKETYSSNDLILSLNKHYNLWKSNSDYTQQFHDLNLSDNDGFVFDPEESTLTISSSSSSYYINSGLENLTIIVSGSISMSHIAFGAPEDTQAEGITTGTLTITGKEDSESSSSINSLSLSNSGGVITGFSSVDLTLPMHVSSPENFTGWTASVTSATITDETYNPSWRFEHGQSYATYCDPSADIYLPSTITPSVITEISGSTVKTQALSYIPKGVPVLLSKTNNTATTATFSKNLLKFAESDNPVTASEGKVLYVLYNDQFVKVTPESEIYYAGYLDLTGVNLPANTRGLTIDGDDEGTTALREVRSEGVKGEKWDDGEWYTLQGRKFTTKPTKPGLYILNGKKVVIK